MADPDHPIDSPAVPGNRIQTRILRWKLTRWTLTVAILMLGAAWWVDGERNPKVLYLENFSWIVGIALLVMGLWLLFFGKIHFFWIVDVDLKEERPAFRVGIPFFHLRISETWANGCYRIRRTNMYLVVPTLVRLFVLAYVCYLMFGFLDDRFWKGGAFVGTCLFGLVTWVIHKIWFPGTGDPNVSGAAFDDIDLSDAAD